MEDLKACPFCGTNGYLIHGKGHDTDDRFFVYCNYCGCQGPQADDMRGAEKEWQNRPDVSG